jgi:superfamily II DNA/RNA helicase
MSSDRSTRERDRIMQNFRKGNIDILVATDILSRGLNIAHVDYVINYELPERNREQEYIHRIGRCGRVGNVGRAITFFDPERDSRAADELIKVSAFAEEFNEF